MRKYNFTTEYHVNLAKVSNEIETAKKAYADFEKDYLYILDLSNPASITEAYKVAKNRGIFEKAKSVRNLIFRKDMHFYGVVYMSDFCANSCTYCPGGEENRKCAIAKGVAYPRKALTLEQIIRETRAVLKNGHSHICYLEGSPAKKQISNNNYAKRIAKIVAEVIRQTANEGLEEIILNIEPLTETGFAMVADAARKANEEVETNVAIQFRVFQETYNRKVYTEMHPQNVVGSRPKADYDNRRESQTRALRGGFDSIGLGVLLGLNRYPMEEIRGLINHIRDLQKEFPGTLPARVAIPSANELKNIGTRIPYVMKTGQTRPQKEGERLGKFAMGDYEKLNELIYALARLAMPEVNIVDSERDTPEMLEVLDHYATCTTLGVKAGVGGNSNIPLKEMTSENEYNRYQKSLGKTATFCQSTTFPRDISETLKKMKANGFYPIFRG